ncbi:hypothetical protein EJ03DRAFT_29313 [Teratosphaeria nubilosa]|uniref:Uncharacterized protein n=1 Tax=Teratosphaeria nubilosa TaxID=161662 RepID=A0A6G1LFQ7_9PEZI|nr:hypothetical protein EJ03DRAFT_29313 [Teratosphaeria nubilosa]
MEGQGRILSGSTTSLAWVIARDQSPPWEPINGSCTIFEDFFSNAINANTCTNVYHVTDSSPVASKILGVPASPWPESFITQPARPDVRQALHRPTDSTPAWHICSPPPESLPQ